MGDSVLKTTPSAVSDQQPNFTWEEGPNQLWVRFPVLPASRGCAMALLVSAILLLSPLLIAILWNLINDPTDLTAWIGSTVGLTIGTGLLWYLIANVQQSRIPVQPSVLTISNGALKIERAGLRRNLDVSWELTEIADIRLSPTAYPAIIFGPGELVKYAFLAPDDVIRISVMLPSGEVENVLLRAPGKYWADALEEKLRSYLRLPGMGS